MTNFTDHYRYHGQILQDSHADRTKTTVTNLRNRTAYRHRVLTTLINVLHNRAKAHIVRTAVHMPRIKGKQRVVTTLVKRNAQHSHPRYNTYDSYTTRRHLISR